VSPDLVFADDGYSGARLDRPALDRLRDLAAEGGVAAVLIAAPDAPARLAITARFGHHNSQRLCQ